jgi:hypothetical protein
MPVCKDCIQFTPGTGTQGECKINGPTDPDREAERCPSRTFIPRPPAPAKTGRR